MNTGASQHSRVTGPQRPLRVLFVDTQTELCGTSHALLTTLENLERSEVEPVYVCLTPAHTEMFPRVQALGIPAHHLPAGRFRDLLTTARAIRGLRALIRRERIDVLLTNSGHPLLFARPAALGTGRPCAWWVHAYVPRNGLGGEPIAVAERILGADALFGNSEYTAHLLRQDFAGHPSIRVVRPGVDLSRFLPDPKAGFRTRATLGIGAEEPVVGMFGRLQRWKGQDVFLRAAAHIKRRGSACRFLVVGSSQFGIELSYAGQLRRQVEEEGLGGCVEFVGQRSDVNELMNACDIVVHASVEPEPWGLVVAEAMAAGRPVIASAAGGPVEMITSGENGLLVEPGQPEDLAAAIESLLRDPQRRQAMGEAARQRAVELFDAARAAAVLSTELREVFRASGGRNGHDR